MKESEFKKTISIKELLKGIDYECGSFLKESVVTGISLDSRNISKGDLFFAVDGFNQNGNTFIDDALKNGAAVILSDKEHKKDRIIFIPNLRWHIGYIASRFYGDPSKSLEIFAVTGTNGKTTCVEIISQIGNLLGKKTGYISTIGSSYEGANLDSELNLTTPSPVDLQRILCEMRAGEVELVAIEASSHGLDQFRLNGIEIDVGILTSFSHDHLDYHKGMDHYARAKLRLFTEFNLKVAILSGKSIKEPVFEEEMKKLNWPSKNTRTKVIFLDQNGMEYDSQGRVIVRDETSEFSLDTISKYLALNVKCALSAFEARGYDLKKVNHLLHRLKFPKGRMEEIELSYKDKCFVDYAHTPQALYDSLWSILDVFPHHNIWCIFGCGGDRDEKKRPLMAELAEARADHIVVTNDNPRTENELKIIMEITSGFRSETSYKVILDRKEAIYYCLNKIAKSNKSNVLLIAGKGHEEYQEINGKRIPFSDKEVVESYYINS